MIELKARARSRFFMKGLLVAVPREGSVGRALDPIPRRSLARQARIRTAETPGPGHTIFVWTLRAARPCALHPQLPGLRVHEPHPLPDLLRPLQLALDRHVDVAHGAPARQLPLRR